MKIAKTFVAKKIGAHGINTIKSFGDTKMKTIMFQCALCGCDKFHICKEPGAGNMNDFVSCSVCGTRTKIGPIYDDHDTLEACG